ncbi:MAG: class I SAM-dependent methyltransferase [Bacteroidota bacterium]
MKALDKVIPKEKNKSGLEIGIGTGRFAEKLGITHGLDPAKAMADIAENRGIPTEIATAEDMPFKSNTFDYAVMITVDCFLEDISKAFLETARILKPNGQFIIGIIDKNSPLGQRYQQHKEDNLFYRHAQFHSVDMITKYLKEAEFVISQYWQTLITASEEEPEEPQPRYGEGGFVAIKAVLN